MLKTVFNFNYNIYLFLLIKSIKGLNYFNEKNVKPKIALFFVTCPKYKANLSSQKGYNSFFIC